MLCHTFVLLRNLKISLETALKNAIHKVWKKHFLEIQKSFL